MDSDRLGNSKESSTSNTIEPPSVNLPKGGGAIRGMGEKFAANPVTGTGSMNVPIVTSPGRSGFDPELSLAYDSGAGNGPFGFGWNLSLPAISRKTDKGRPQYCDAVESDVFLLSGAEDLVPVLKPEGGRFEDGTSVPDYTIHRYRPRIEGLFARIERWTRSDGDIHWRSISKDNVLTLYGKDANSRIVDPEDPSHIFSWLICETRDDKGNVVLYEYKPEDGTGVDLTRVNERNRGNQNDVRRAVNRYLKRIQYGNRVPLLNDDGHRPRFLSVKVIQDAGWMFEVVFDYGEHNLKAPASDDTGEWDFRADPFSTYRAGFEIRTTRLCQRVLMFHHIPDIAGEVQGYDGLVRSTDFTYSHEQDSDNARNPIYTFLRAVTQVGYKRDGGGYLKRSLPPVEFEYTEPVVQDTVEEVDPASLENLPIGVDGAAYQWTDLHGEGIPGILTEQGGDWFYKRNLTPISEGPVAFSPQERVATKPNLALAGGAQFMDLAGDGQPDLVMLDEPTLGLYEHDGKAGWQSFRPFTSRLIRDLRDPNLRFVDLNGDGHADILISEDHAFVWHASLAEAGFGPARCVQQALDEEKGPRLVFADGTQSIYLADLSGDGLSDLVRIRNGEICYWPNLGYGRFGAKITMDHAPHFDQPDQFDHKRIRLADIDGTGTTDIIYLHRNGVRLYFNQSGNSWSAPQVLRVFPRIDELVSIAPADLLGNGTACLVWSSPLSRDAQRPMRYVNLMGGQKPHLLIKTIDNLGAETRVRYTPSTKFYLQDKRDGEPWITRLPFPVHVVEQVETYDHISRNRFVTRYAYHHGYFDGVEREFRGFGMVEQWDTEEYATLANTDSLVSSGEEGWGEAATNEDLASHIPPVLTKTWYHTGAYLGRNHISDFFAGLLDANDIGGYYREPGLTDPQARALLLQDTVMPAGFSVDEEREACRALKGAMLRQEVYAQDGTDKAPHPYNVTEQNFTIRCIQPKAGNRYAVFLTHAREAINYHYERNPTDPRISHAMTLEVDHYGNVLKEAAIGYGRREKILVLDDEGEVAEIPNPTLGDLAPEDQAKQTQTLATYTENHVTIAIETVDDYRTPLPCETCSYELTDYTPTGAAGRFQISEFVQPDPSDPNGLKKLHLFDGEVDYADAPPSGRQRRLVEKLRTQYRPDDLGVSINDPLNDPLALLPLGIIEPLAVPGETYKLAFTPNLLTQIYQRNGQSLLPDPAAVLGGQGPDQGGYVDLDNDRHWWIPAGRMFYSPAIGDSAAQELVYARQHFFLPHRYLDPFGQTTTVAYDPYDLLLLETQDPLGNRDTVGERDASGNITLQGNDYRVIQPRLLMDPNRNRSTVSFDTLGMVVGTAVTGKPEEHLGDSLDGFVVDLLESDILDHLNNPLTDPHAILGHATTRLVYDLFAYQRSKYTPDPQPTVVYTLARETHDSDLEPGQQTRIQHSFGYSDGFGREIQKKIQAEPGPLAMDDPNAPVVDPRWVGSGWTIFNNKGKPVRQYEPFFDDTHKFRFGKQIGVSPILFYDPAEQLVATLHPNHTWEKVVFDPWRQETWDVNDTVTQTDPEDDPDVGDFFRRLPDSDYLPTWYEQRQGGTFGPEEQAAAGKAADHANTPALAYLDTLGRTFLSIADNGSHGQYPTRVELDIEGNTRLVTDARGNPVMAYSYNMVGPEEEEDEGVEEEEAGEEESEEAPDSHLLYQNSMDAGERWLLYNAAGNLIRKWDSQDRGHCYRYDALQRETHVFVQQGAATQILAEQTVYGESLNSPESLNLRDEVYQQFDGAGVITQERYDFKGNLLESTRQLAVAYKHTLDWSSSPALESEIFTTTTAYDAFDREISSMVIRSTTPDANTVLNHYNEAGLLDRITTNLHGATTTVVANIDYNAKGQRTAIEYGNGVRTTYLYDPDTFRLTRLKTVRYSDNARLQDLNYTYDPVSNIVAIRDDAQQTIFYANAVITPSSEYEYDPLYRLIKATGREHVGQNSAPPDHADPVPIAIPHSNDINAFRRYTETDEYDSVGNILLMKHQWADGAWVRRYEYAADSNRLLSTSLPGDPEGGPYSAVYDYDSHGNMDRMPHLLSIQWDYVDRMQGAERGDGSSVFYVYDSDGERVRKVYEHNGATVEERIYLSGFEIYRKRNISGLVLERESLHVMDDEKRIALVESKTHDQVIVESPIPITRIQLDNHLGASMLELDHKGFVISYEEYHPYGTTSYLSMRSDVEVTVKRYRYTAKERDEETGLSYHGTRYYSLSLARWTSCDPSLTDDGLNLYSYAHNNPAILVDVDGMQTKSSMLGWIYSRMQDLTRSPGAIAKYIAKSAMRPGKFTILWRALTSIKTLPAPAIAPKVQAPIVHRQKPTTRIFRDPPEKTSPTPTPRPKPRTKSLSPSEQRQRDNARNIERAKRSELRRRLRRRGGSAGTSGSRKPPGNVGKRMGTKSRVTIGTKPRGATRFSGIRTALGTVLGILGAASILLQAYGMHRSSKKHGYIDYGPFRIITNPRRLPEGTRVRDIMRPFGQEYIKTRTGFVPAPI